MARTTYRIEHSKDGSDWRTFMAWSGLQKCRAEGAFGILMSMYDGVWYRLVEEGGQVIEVSHHAVPSVGKKAERVFTESEVRAAAMAEPELPGDMPDEMWDAIQRDKDAATEAMRIIVRQTRDGILRRLFDPA